jgi:hypothetical protein
MLVGISERTLMFPGMGGLDPSKMTPQVIAEITEAMKMLTPGQMMKLQTLMHNQMAGFDVMKEMAALEQTLPQGFRERMARVIYLANGITVPSAGANPGTATPPASAVEDAKLPGNPDEARLVILRSVSSGLMSPEEALRVLFP